MDIISTKDIMARIHEDTIRYADYIRYKDKLYIIPIDIQKLIKHEQPWNRFFETGLVCKTTKK